MVVKSIKSTSLNVKPLVRLCDKNDWYFLTKQKYKTSKNPEGRFLNPSQAVLFISMASFKYACIYGYPVGI